MNREPVAEIGNPIIEIEAPGAFPGVVCRRLIRGARHARVAIP